MSAEVIQKFLVGTVLPVIAGALTAWLLSTKVMSIFGVGGDEVAKAISGGLTFVVVTAISWLKIHHILKNSYPAK